MAPIDSAEARHVANLPLSMTAKRHGQQVFDRIAAGEFYMICDNIRPCVLYSCAARRSAMGHVRGVWATGVVCFTAPTPHTWALGRCGEVARDQKQERKRERASEKT